MPAGYSGTPLARKLGIKDGYTIVLYHPPSHYFELFSDLPENLDIREDKQTESADFIHLFCTSINELEEVALAHKKALKKNGMLWVSWPKGSSSIKTDLKRDYIREYLIENGLVDVKVAAIDEDWSGLKFMYRVEDR